MLESLEKNAVDWDYRRLAVSEVYVNAPVQHGAAAYVARQAAYQRGLKIKFHGMWTYRDPAPADTDTSKEQHEDGAHVLVTYITNASDDEDARDDNDDDDSSD